MLCFSSGHFHCTLLKCRLQFDSIAHLWGNSGCDFVHYKPLTAKCFYSFSLRMLVAGCHHNYNDADAAVYARYMAGPYAWGWRR